MKWTLVFAVTLAACTKTNSKYCEAPGDCMAGSCDVQLHRCVAGDGGRDAQQPDARMGCRGPSDCTSQAPICVGADAGMGGMCVECVGADDCHDPSKPICTSNVCVPCTTDLQCGTRADNGGIGLCEGGACPTPTQVAVVDGTTAADCATRTGTPAMPYCSLDTALATDATHMMFFLKPGGMHHGATINGRNLVVIGRNTEVTGTSKYFFHVQNGSLTLRHLVLDNNTSNSGGVPDGIALFCEGNTTHCSAEDVVVGPNDGQGIVVTDAELKLRRSTIQQNYMGGVYLDGPSMFEIENDFFADNGHKNAAGAPAQTYGAIFVNSLGAGSGEIRSDTFFSNHADPILGVTPTWSGSITCNYFGGRMVNVVNDVFWKNSPVRIGASRPDACPAHYSLSDDPMAIGTGNKTGDPLFVREMPPSNLHITATSPAKDSGDPTSAPPDDIDGKPRDSMPDMGADEFGP
jgi:hypothetical protein